MVIAAPLAERIAATIGMQALTRSGLAITTIGLAVLALGTTSLPLLALGMLIQGFGQGLFQVANFDQVTGALPPQDRGVAGSLALLTRTFGLMLGATLLMLLMQTLAGGPAPAQVITGIGGTYAIAALITAVLMLIGRRK
jgi:MFS family permease